MSKDPRILRHVAWFNEAPVQPAMDGSLTSGDKRVRERCLGPARELEKLGVDCSVFGNLHDADPVHVGQHLQKLGSDIVVVDGLSGPHLIKLARTAKHMGCYIVVDFDTQGTVSPNMMQFCEIADHLVAATPEAIEIIEKDIKRPVTLIPDGDDGEIAKLWLECFRKLKTRPPVCANSNNPEA